MLVANGSLLFTRSFVGNRLMIPFALEEAKTVLDLLRLIEVIGLLP